MATSSRELAAELEKDLKDQAQEQRSVRRTSYIPQVASILCGLRPQPQGLLRPHEEALVVGRGVGEMADRGHSMLCFGDEGYQVAKDMMTMARVTRALQEAESLSSQKESGIYNHYSERTSDQIQGLSQARGRASACMRRALWRRFGGAGRGVRSPGGDGDVLIPPAAVRPSAKWRVTGRPTGARLACLAFSATLVLREVKRASLRPARSSRRCIRWS